MIVQDHGASKTPSCLTLVAPPSVLACLRPALADVAGVTATGTPPDGLHWCFETDGGVEIDLPATAIKRWERPPYCMLIRLRPSVPGQFPVHQATIGTRLSLAALQAKIVRTMLVLLRAATGSAGPVPRALRGHAAAAGAAGPALAAGMLRRAKHRLQDWVLVEEGAIGLVPQRVETRLGDERMQPPRWLRGKRGINLADPHPRLGSNRILCEEFGDDPGAASSRGRIVCLELDRQEAAITRSRVILGGALHRSYPGSVRAGNDIVFLPETPSRGATELFRLTEGDRPEWLCRVGLPLRMADPTLFRHDGRFWISYTDLDIGEHDNLCLLHAPALTGPWTPHRGNPVKLDIRSSRPAGPVISHRGRLYRPAQNCAASYGAAVVINRIEQLTPDRFSEVAVREIRPAARGPYPHGLHTLASRGDTVLIDGKRRVFRSRILLGKLRRRLRPVLRPQARPAVAWGAA